VEGKRYDYLMRMLINKRLSALKQEWIILTLPNGN